MYGLYRIYLCTQKVMLFFVHSFFLFSLFFLFFLNKVPSWLCVHVLVKFKWTHLKHLTSADWFSTSQFGIRSFDREALFSWRRSISLWAFVLSLSLSIISLFLFSSLTKTNRCACRFSCNEKIEWHTRRLCVFKCWLGEKLIIKFDIIDISNGPLLFVTCSAFRMIIIWISWSKYALN